mgnify:CR=1 FL=1
MMSVKMIEKQETQNINTEEVRKAGFDKTQIIDLEKQILSQETAVATESFSQNNQNTIMILPYEYINQDDDGALQYTGFTCYRLYRSR